MPDDNVKITGAVEAGKITMPERKKAGRGSSSKYPFDTLTAVGMCFGIEGKTAKDMASVVSNQNKKDENRTPKKDENGNTVYKTKTIKDANGNETTVPDLTKPEMISTKRFFAVDVDEAKKKEIKGTPLEKATVLIFRDV